MGIKVAMAELEWLCWAFAILGMSCGIRDYGRMLRDQHRDRTQMSLGDRPQRDTPGEGATATVEPRLSHVTCAP